MTKIKKILLYGGIGILILLVGIAVGLIVAKTYFNLNKEKIYSSIQNEKKTLSEITPEQIANLTALNPGRIIYGDVKSKENNEIVIVIPFSNPVAPEEKKNVEVKIPIDPKDEILRDEKPIFISNIQINDYVIIEILEDKKIIRVATVK